MWYISMEMDNNWMQTPLKYGFQADAFSCGFYVLAAMRSILSLESALLLVKYRTCDANLTEVNRYFCARRYVEAILMYATQNAGGVADVGLFWYTGSAEHLRDAKKSRTALEETK